MSTTPFMQLYIADYLGDTQHLTAIEHGAYLLLLMAMWRADGKLPNDPQKLCRIARVHPPHWKRVASIVMPFFEAEGEFITQKRLTNELSRVHHKCQLRASVGSLGGKAKALNNKKSTLAIATGLLYHSSDIIKKEDARAAREINGAEKKKGTRAPDFVKVTNQDPDWPRLVARFRAEKKRPLNVSEHYFPAEWLKEQAA